MMEHGIWGKLNALFRTFARCQLRGVQRGDLGSTSLDDIMLSVPLGWMERVDAVLVRVIENQLSHFPFS